MLDASAPDPDRDSGSVDAVYHIRAFRHLGYEVSFFPEDCREPAHSALLDEGAECLAGPGASGLLEHLRTQGDRYYLVFISRGPVAARNIRKVRKHCPRARIIFNTVDLHFLRLEREASLPGHASRWRKARRLRRMEAGAMKLADATLVISTHEEKVVAGLWPEVLVRTLPYVREVHPDTTPFESRRDLVFIGCFLHAPNRDAVEYFAHRVWPKVRERLPGASFRICGSHFPDALRGLGEIPGVVIMGHIPHLETLFTAARVSVAPLRFGAGIKGKVGTSLAFGVPCVATSLAVEGMELEPGQGVLIADTEEDLAAAVIRAYTEPETWRSLSECGREALRQKFSFGNTVSKLSSLLQLLEEAQPREARRPGLFRRFRGHVRDQMRVAFGACLQRLFSLGDPPQLPRTPPRRFLIMPGEDPGSVGDQAMFLALLDLLGGPEAVGVVHRRPGRPLMHPYPEGVRLEPVWKNFSGFIRFIRAMKGYDAFLILGADVMDGHYSEMETTRRLLYAHTARRLGRRAAILGFSFNTAPTGATLAAFRQLPSDVPALLRDPASLERFRALVPRASSLVADLAFLLEPRLLRPETRELADWSRAGRTLGINLNPLLYRQRHPLERRALVLSFASLLETLAAEDPAFRFLLLPHDYRSKVGDMDLLLQLQEMLSPGTASRTRLADPTLDAMEVKGLCSSLHAVISCRMHLCIAALGQGVPALGIAYQDKFPGLFEHFGISPAPVLSPDEALDSGKLSSGVRSFLSHHSALRSAITDALPAVIHHARNNTRGWQHEPPAEDPSILREQTP